MNFDLSEEKKNLFYKITFLTTYETIIKSKAINIYSMQFIIKYKSDNLNSKLG